jgi:hypothetical protein
MKSLMLISGWEYMILVMIVFGVVVPLVLFMQGLARYKQNKKRGKVILIIATVYAIISFGVCGGFSI